MVFCKSSIHFKLASFLLFIQLSLALLFSNQKHVAEIPKGSCGRCLKIQLSSSSKSNSEDKFAPIYRAISREYASFFQPMDRKYYASDVVFVDPMTTFEGIDKYQNNVDFLAGRTGFGRVMFSDASISLHKIEKLSENQFLTRWTLQVTVKGLPWRPKARFTGISKYTLAQSGQIAKQEDFWDSVNLINGKYKTVPTQEGISDFLGQLKNENTAALSAPELPYELLRRSKYYEVRRYPDFCAIETSYDKRPEGYDRLGSYAGGSNEESKKLQFFSPTIMRIEDTANGRSKTMTWPMLFDLPGGQKTSASDLPTPTISTVERIKRDSIVVAVLRFEAAATEPLVRKGTSELLQCIRNDGLIPSSDALKGVCIVGQFDALFSLNKRRNEVWVELIDHPWI